MQYRRRKELPENVVKLLPVHAQDIYLSAFNRAWARFKNKADSDRDNSREETAHKVAWSAVKNRYEKVEGKWQLR